MLMKTLWSSDSNQTKLNAEEAAGPSELGYLYRLDWCPIVRNAVLRAYRIIKFTPCGCRIALGRGIVTASTRVVIDKSFRKFAHRTVAEAVTSYLARKTRYRSLLQYRIQEANDMIAAVQQPDIKRQLDFIVGDIDLPLMRPIRSKSPVHCSDY